MVGGTQHLAGALAPSSTQQIPVDSVDEVLAAWHVHMVGHLSFPFHPHSGAQLRSRESLAVGAPRFLRVDAWEDLAVRHASASRPR